MSQPVPDGLVLDGRWRIERQIAVGGMSTVHAASDLQEGTTVAVKVLQREALAVPELVARFRRERRILGMMTSAHVPRLLGEGKLDDGIPYLVMEYLEGSTLADLSGSWGALPFEAAAGYIIQICEAIAEAHSLGVIHRDLKPANIFITRGPDGFAQVKVLDFGISKSSLPSQQGWEAREPTLTRATDVLGSPQYMSPEQLLASRQVDYTADIWSLGVLLYEMVTGALPFDGQTVEMVRAAVMTTRPRPAGALRPELPAGLEAAIARCLERFAEDRFPTVVELAQALLPFALPAAAAEAEVDRIVGVGLPARPPMLSDPAAAGFDVVDVWDPDASSLSKLPRVAPGPAVPKLAILYGPFPEPHVPGPYVPPSVLRRRALWSVAKVLLATALAGLLAGLVLGGAGSLLWYW